MFGSRIFGRREIVSEIVEHAVFKRRSGALTRGLVRVLGRLYIRLLGWPVQEPRLYHRKLVRLLEPGPSDSILDVGCGYGVHALDIAARYGSTVTGIDIDEDDIRFAKVVGEANGLHNCRFMCMDAVDLRFEPESFDKVICMAVLEHIEDDSLAVENMRQVLREGGVLVGVVPGDKRTWLKPDCCQGSNDPEGHGHVREGYSLEDIEHLMTRNGLQLVHYEYVGNKLEGMLAMVQLKTNQYVAFPFTYPLAYLFSRSPGHDGAVLFKAVKRSGVRR